jgi:hypothetical protein
MISEHTELLLHHQPAQP